MCKTSGEGVTECGVRTGIRQEHQKLLDFVTQHAPDFRRRSGKERERGEEGGLRTGAKTTRGRDSRRGRVGVGGDSLAVLH